MSYLLPLILLSLLLGLTTGCDGRYEWKNDEQGRMVRVDKWTGNVAILKDDKLILVPALKPKTQDKLKDVKVTRVFGNLETCQADLQKVVERYPGINCIAEEQYKIVRADGTELPNAVFRDVSTKKADPLGIR